LKTTSPSLVPAISWLIISTALLTIPGTAFPKENWLDKLAFDKVVHFVMFALMVITWCLGLARLNRNKVRTKKGILLVAICSFAYGTGMEFIQHHLIPYRSFDVGDIIADGAGCVAGLIFSLRRYIKK
jgi:VanZ family protein